MSGISVPAPRGAPWLDRALALRDRVATLRDRLVANPRFRRWAAAFPLTRPIARRRTRALFDLCAGFVYSQVLAACVRLDVFNVLAEGPDTAAALSARLSLPPEETERLLSAAASLGLAARRGGGRYGLGPLGAAMVGNAAIAEMVRHHAMLYADLADPVALLRGQAQDQPCSAPIVLTGRATQTCTGTTAYNSFFGDGIVDALAAVQR